MLAVPCALLVAGRLRDSTGAGLGAGLALTPVWIVPSHSTCMVSGSTIATDAHAPVPIVSHAPIKFFSRLHSHGKECRMGRY